MRRTLALLLKLALLAALLVLPERIGAQGGGPDLVALATAFNAAWNAHELDATVAFFTDDAVIRQVAPVIAGYDEGMVTVDTYGVSLFVGHARGNPAQDSLVLASGRGEVRGWVATLFAAGHRLEAAAYQLTAPDEVNWSYRASAEPLRGIAGVSPAAGTARAALRQGRIASLVLATDPGSISRRSEEVATAVARGAQLRPAGPPARAGGAPGPWIIAAILSLAGVIGLAAFKQPPRTR